MHNLISQIVLLISSFSLSNGMDLLLIMYFEFIFMVW